MGVTAIKKVENRVPGLMVRVVNFENPGDTGGPKGAIFVAPGATVDLNMWIPWCTKGADFPKHHILVGVDGTSPLQLFAVWQAWQSDGDFVRVSPSNAFANPGSRPAGVAKVDGDRKLVVASTKPSAGSLVLEALEPVHTQPSSGIDDVALGRPIQPVDPFAYTGGSMRKDALITFVKNVAQDVNGAVNIPLYLTFRETATGRTIESVRVDPRQETHAFDGLHLDGSWKARASDVSATMLRDWVAIQVGWRRP